MRRSIYLSVFVILASVALIISGCSKDDDGGGGGDNTIYAALDYYPLGVGWHWTYTDTDGSDTSTTEIVGTVEMDDYTTYLVVDDSTDTTYVQARNGAIYVYLPEQDTFLIMIPTTFTVGQTWTMFDFDTTYNSGGFDYHNWVTITSTILSTESVDVPAGNFSCLKMANIMESGTSIDVGDSTIDNVNVDTNYIWVAKNIGYIKELDSDGTVSVLINYTAGD
ncbi:hypothetical protein J7L68_02980 [bacterium]|nr:hypothetical protein [bacterium]